MKKKRIFLIIGILFAIMTILSTSYAFFYYNKSGEGTKESPFEIAM